MHDENPEETPQERDPQEELLVKAQEKFQAGDFEKVRIWLEEKLSEGAEETTVLKPVRDNMKLDPGAVVVVAVCGLAFIVIAVLTWFH